MNENTNFYTEGIIFLTKFTVFISVLFIVANYGTSYFADKYFLPRYDTTKVEIQISELAEKREIWLLAENVRKRELALQNKILETRTIRDRYLKDYIPTEGKFVGIDLLIMKAFLYEDGEMLESFDVISKGKPGSHWETPTGDYEIMLKEQNHFSSIGGVFMPYSMQFYGNFFIHGWPYYPDGTEVSEGYSGGCIRMSTEDAKKIFSFSEKGTDIFVYDDNVDTTQFSSVVKIRNIPKPNVSAKALLVADIDTGDVYFEKGSDVRVPIASITKLMTAIVANETISFDKRIAVVNNTKQQTEGDYGKLKTGEILTVGELFYPLLMESNNMVADSIASFYGKNNFISWMNTKAKAIGMEHTQFNDASGISNKNTSTANDLFRLGQYLNEKKSFILNISKEKEKKVVVESGKEYIFQNFNHFSGKDNFVGGKTGFTNAAHETMLSLFDIVIGGETHTLAIIVLGSDNREKDTEALLSWFDRASVSSAKGL